MRYLIRLIAIMGMAAIVTSSGQAEDPVIVEKRRSLDATIKEYESDIKKSKTKALKEINELTNKVTSGKGYSTAARKARLAELEAAKTSLEKSNRWTIKPIDRQLLDVQRDHAIRVAIEAEKVVNKYDELIRRLQQIKDNVGAKKVEKEKEAFEVKIPGRDDLVKNTRWEGKRDDGLNRQNMTQTLIIKEINGNIIDAEIRMNIDPTNKPILAIRGEITGGTVFFSPVEIIQGRLVLRFFKAILMGDGTLYMLEGGANLRNAKPVGGTSFMFKK